jgi:hypothetical protein
LDVSSENSLTRVIDVAEDGSCSGVLTPFSTACKKLNMAEWKTRDW